MWLNLSWPWIAEAVDLLRARGYFLGGLLPRWFNEDGILMQKILARPHREGIKIQFERAERILEMIRSDWERARKT